MGEHERSDSAFSFRLIIIALLIIGVAIAVALPNFLRARGTCCGNACINNLRQLDAAVNQFALENHKTNGEHINFPNDLTPYIKQNAAGKIPGCPAGGTYYINKVGDTPICTLGNTVTPSHFLP